MVEESPAEPSDEAPTLVKKEPHKFRDRLPGVDVGNPQTTQGPDTQGDKSGGEAKSLNFKLT